MVQLSFIPQVGAANRSMRTGLGEKSMLAFVDISRTGQNTGL